MSTPLRELLTQNDELQRSRAVRLLAAKNLAPYITLWGATSTTASKWLNQSWLPAWGRIWLVSGSTRCRR